MADIVARHGTRSNQICRITEAIRHQAGGKRVPPQNLSPDVP
ncbi:hypothetical protein USDA257_c52540 [Sinorhizobium fredii USDA 257]|uniref:Uncharacterized protein n=1 Tax=Sinorhizobium fredii (strain USDA 257) TaxID=1185652 RepID=I3XD23_SINF2|nr:hypothetical protein USDA257_c52540 [Sinorhizobium fredii USDA 257]